MITLEDTQYVAELRYTLSLELGVPRNEPKIKELGDRVTKALEVMKRHQNKEEWEKKTMSLTDRQSHTEMGELLKIGNARLMSFSKKAQMLDGQLDWLTAMVQN